MGKVLITGGAGYIGSHVVKRLLEKGMETIVLDNMQTGHREAVVGGTCIQGDIGDEQTLQDILVMNKPSRTYSRPMKSTPLFTWRRIAWWETR
jgi:UDP-glucose 4-epimerase